MVCSVAVGAASKPVIEHWSTLIVKVVRTPEIAARLIDLGLEPTDTTPKALAAIRAADTARWAPIVRASAFTAH